MFSLDQETLIIDMAHQNNATKLLEIYQKIPKNFEGVNSVSLYTTDYVLKCNRMWIKCLCKYPLTATQRGSRKKDSSMYR